MKNIRILLLGALVAAGPAMAADKVAGKRPGVMATCEAVADARSLVGVDRRRFLAECFQLERKRPASLRVQLATCEASAREQRLHGDRLRGFIGRCLGA